MIQEKSELMPDLDREVILQETRPFDPLTRLEEFSKRFPSAIEILRIGGVHPTEVIEMGNPYTDRPDAESFTNAGEHCLAVASFAETVAKRLQKIGLLTSDEVDRATERGLIHDGNKRIEVFRKKAAAANILPTADVYSPNGYATIAPILLAQGFDQRTVEYMAQAGKETGHLSIRDFLALPDGIPSLVPGRMVEKIIHLADDMTSTSIPQQAGERPLTVYLTPWERMVASEFPRKYPDLWQKGLGFNPKGQIINLEDIVTADRNLRWVRNYAYWQPFVSNEICREIQNIIDPESKQKPEHFVKEFVNNVLAPAA